MTRPVDREVSSRSWRHVSSAFGISRSMWHMNAYDAYATRVAVILHHISEDPCSTGCHFIHQGLHRYRWSLSIWDTNSGQQPPASTTRVTRVPSSGSTGWIRGNHRGQPLGSRGGSKSQGFFRGPEWTVANGGTL